MIVFGADMMHVFYGASYESGGAVMAIFTLGLVFSSLTYTQSLALAAMRLVKIELLISGISCVVNVILLVILIPVLGMEGAALAGFACFFTSFVLLQYYGQKILGFHQPKEAYKLLLSALLTFLIVLLLKPFASSTTSLLLSRFGSSGDLLSKAAYLMYLGVMIAFAGLFFIAFSLLMRCFKGEDIELMEKTMGKIWIPRRLISLAARIASYGVAG
jgi:peptidoglycan biosynthesis protein MviN/MurJ (putative lipid II flippase)